MAVSRREFLTGLAGAGLGFGLGAISHEFPLPPPSVGPDWRPGNDNTNAPPHCLDSPNR